MVKERRLLVVSSGGVGSTYVISALSAALKFQGMTVNDRNDGDRLKHAYFDDDTRSRVECFDPDFVLYIFSSPAPAIASHFRRRWQFAQYQKLHPPSAEAAFAALGHNASRLLESLLPVALLPSSTGSNVQDGLAPGTSLLPRLQAAAGAPAPAHESFELCAGGTPWQGPPDSTDLLDPSVPGSYLAPLPLRQFSRYVMSVVCGSVDVLGLEQHAWSWLRAALAGEVRGTTGDEAQQKPVPVLFIDIATLLQRDALLRLTELLAVTGRSLTFLRFKPRVVRTEEQVLAEVAREEALAIERGSKPAKGKTVVGNAERVDAVIAQAAVNARVDIPPPVLLAYRQFYNTLYERRLRPLDGLLVGA